MARSHARQGSETDAVRLALMRVRRFPAWAGPPLIGLVLRNYGASMPNGQLAARLAGHSTARFRTPVNSCIDQKMSCRCLSGIDLDQKVLDESGFGRKVEGVGRV